MPIFNRLRAYVRKSGFWVYFLSLSALDVIMTRTSIRGFTGDKKRE